MNEQTIVALCMGGAFLLIGCLMTVSPKFASWGLSYGKGKMWVRLLGFERALMVTRCFFGPLCIVLGLAAFAMALYGK